MNQTNAMARAARAKKVTWVGFWVNVVLSVAKIIAGIVGRSGAMIADGVHSISDFVTDIIVIVFIGVSAKGENTRFRYGHGKFETFATMLISFALFAVAVGLFWTSFSQIVDALNGKVLPRPEMVALVMAFVSVVAKEWLFHYTRVAGEQMNSMALVANAWHHRSDALSSIGTMFGIGGAIILGEKWAVLDPLAAIIVSAFIIKAAWGLVMQSVKELTDASLPETEEDEILKIANEEQGVGEIHNLRTRRIGNKIAIEMHVRMPGSLSLYEAHEHATHIETKLKQHFGADTHVGIHLEPIKVNGKYQKPE